MKDKHLYIVKGFAHNKPQEHIVCYVLSDKLENTVNYTTNKNKDMIITSITKGELIIDDSDRNNIVLTTKREFGYNTGPISLERINKILILYRINTCTSSIILEGYHSLSAKKFADIKKKIFIHNNLSKDNIDFEITDIIFLY